MVDIESRAFELRFLMTPVYGRHFVIEKSGAENENALFDDLCDKHT